MEYLTNELLCISEVEVRQYADAASQLYHMYEKAAQHVIDHNLWEEIGIPDNAVEVIQYSWRYRNLHPHLYGRFDLSGIINGRHAKLIEFNADTATVMPETTMIQQEQLAFAKIKEASQFNDFYEHLTQRFAMLPRLHQRAEKNILFAHLGHEEDALNTNVLVSAAVKAGLQPRITTLDQITFSEEEGIFVDIMRGEYMKFDFWFKLVPWEFIAYEEPDLMAILTKIITKELAVVLNPAYTMIYQSKAIMKILWDLYPNHHLLLKTSHSPSDFRHREYVGKVIFGREGENVEVFNEGGSPLEINGGDFGDYPRIYQAFEPLPEDRDGDIYQAGIYYAGQPSALSYRRRDGLIVDEDSEFIGHYIL
jgi:glutathionylspermidine synthase